MSFKNDTSVQTYLNQLDKVLLTKQEEEVLVRNVEVYQNEIMQACINSIYARNEMKSYLQSLESRGEAIVDISKRLDDESPKDAVDAMQTVFNNLLKALNTTDVTLISSLVSELSLSGMHVHGLVTEIKSKHSSITDVESKVRAIIKYIPGNTIAKMVYQIESNQDQLESILRSEFGLNDVKIQNKINDWKKVATEYRSVEAAMPAGVSFDDIKSTYQSISNFEMLASKYKNELITKNLRLVISRAKKFVDRGLDFSDLIQEGNIGLMKAIDKFDASKKTKVSTYATWWIDQSIRRAISNKGKTVRIPTHIEWMQQKLAEATQKLSGELQRMPTPEELAKATGYDVKQIEENKTRAQHEIGLEEELSSGMAIIDMLASESESPHVYVEKKILREKVRDILAELPPRTEKIIRLRFGIGEEPDAEGTTLQSIADDIGITKQGVRVVECSAFKMLRKKARVLAGE